MVKNKHKHFNPDEHEVNVKMAKVKKSSHCKHNINYHIVFIPKYRKEVLVGEKLKEILATIIKGKCEDLKCELLALEIMPDHVHIFVKANPVASPHWIVQQFKGYSPHQLRKEFPTLKSRLPTLWTRSYYCESVGHISEDTIKKYIEDQKGK